MIERADKVIAALHRLQTESRANNKVSVIVGYTAKYALYVHEAPMKLKGLPRGAGMTRDKRGVVRFSKKMLTTGVVGGGGKGFYWDPQGVAQSKFLEAPFRKNLSKMKSMILRQAKSTRSLDTALLIAGMFLQRESMKIVPVDTGNLKNSAFTRKE